MQASSVDKVSELQVLCGGIQSCLLCRALLSCTISTVGQETALDSLFIDAHSRHAVLDEAECTGQNFSVVAVPVLVLVPGFLL